MKLSQELLCVLYSQSPFFFFYSVSYRILLNHLYLYLYYPLSNYSDIVGHLTKNNRPVLFSDVGGRSPAEILLWLKQKRIRSWHHSCGNYDYNTMTNGRCRAYLYLEEEKEGWQWGAVSRGFCPWTEFEQPLRINLIPEEKRKSKNKF